ncbi:hypothetical protein ES703_30798 [subsurface metagenome]
MRAWNKIWQSVDSVNEGMGRLGWFLIVTMMTLGVYDVIMRYLFSMPTHWVYLVNGAGVVALTALAGGYALHSGIFVKVDILYGRFSPRGKAIADVVTFVFIFLYCGVLVWKGIEQAHWAAVMRQMTPSEPIRLPLYYIKPLIPIGAFFVLLVAIRKFISDVKTVIHK